ncbi:MAG: biotin--[acetyl-CoA-carboxylase] ligase [Parachlamydiales bacterium]|nr:biotin--[acetyl-CoA-carboxylase] ligase [Parachlamydiales bacterium]
MHWEYIFLDSIPSTNLWAKQHYQTFASQKITIVCAEEQTKGIGRCQRCWISPKGAGIYATFYFQLPKKTAHLSTLGLVLCYSLATVLIQEQFSPKIKWPNDVLLQGKKIAGILCETLFTEDHIDIFLGIGINISTPKKILKAIDQPATSLYEETHKTWDKNQILQSLAQEWSRNLELFQKKGFYPFHAPYENLLAYKGKTITCYDGQTNYTGIFHSVNSDGALNLLLPDHTMKTFLAGDISLEK